jgi:hypothetical protein
MEENLNVEYEKIQKNRYLCSSELDNPPFFFFSSNIFERRLPKSQV